MRYFNSNFLIGLFLLWFLPSFCQDQPNIIFILVDDQRYDFLSFKGHPWMKTPHIDRLDRPYHLEIAGAQIPEEMHGQSFFPLLLDRSVDWRNEFLYEYFIDPNAVQTPTIFGLRTQQYSYMTYHGVWDTYELYDMEVDPYQMDNVLGEVTYGIHYGPFLRFVERQQPELFPLVRQLDSKLSTIMKNTGGSRQPTWKEIN